MADKIVAAFPEFNRVWLMTGEGEMLVSSHRHNACADDGDMVLLLPISAMGGPLAGFPTEGVLPYECERMASPVKGADFAITVSGDSMAPEYTSGTKLLIKRIDPSAFIEWGKVYVLDTCNGVIVKEVRKCDGKEGRIVCHSLNPDPKYVDFEVSMGDVYGMYRVLMSLTMR